MNRVRLEIEPLMADASIFSSELHTEKLNNIPQLLHISTALFELLFKRRDMAPEILSSFGWRDPAYLPQEYMRERFITYEHKEQYVAEILEQSTKISLLPEVRSILFDEYSFLKEHSSILMRTRRTLRYFRKMGVAILDLSGRTYHAKHDALQRLKGPRWYLALTTQVVGIAVQSPLINLGGVVIVAMDP